jgi:predicted PolB exonuclease-like 3'-5' exonuclease
MGSIVFDIETGPLAEEVIESLVPEFDPTTVKVGNLKDEEKIKAKVANAEVAHREKWFSKAALSPLTGQVLAIGMRNVGGKYNIGCVDDKVNEAALLSAFWLNYMQLDAGSHLVGFNSHHFDLPFLVRRSWMNNVTVPDGLRERGRFQRSIDLADEWRMTDHEYISLDTISKAFGLSGKDGNGAEFAATFEQNREAAIQYLRKDVELTWHVAMFMQVI